MAAMAAVKSKVNESITNKGKNVDCAQKSEITTLQIWDFCLLFITICTFIANLSTNIVLVAVYFHNGKLYWAIGTLVFIVLPAIIIQIFSMQWYITDFEVNICHWISHAFLLGLFFRHIVILRTGCKARYNEETVDIKSLYLQHNDLCVLHLLESFLESAPQLLLQLYIITNLEDCWNLTGAAAATALTSLAWAMAAYACAQQRRPGRRLPRLRGAGCCVASGGGCGAGGAGATGAALHVLWRAGLLAARFAALLLLAVATGVWLFLLLGIHWISMTVWIILQKTEFSSTQWEERLYNCVIGVVYCFCFFNLKEGPSRRRILIFYCITIAQNLGCLGLFITLAGHSRPILAQAGACAILGGTVLGLTCMLLYYRFFHPAGPLSLSVPPRSQLVSRPVSETASSSVVVSEISTTSFRSLKKRSPLDHDNSPQRLNNASQEDQANVDDAGMDKKLLLNHWTSYATTTPSECVNSDTEVLHAKDDNKIIGETPSLNPCNDDIRKQKRRGICSSEALELELEDPKNLNVLEHKDKILECEERYKRRGICAIEPKLQLDLDITLSNVEVEASLSSTGNENDSEEVRRQKRRGILSSADLCLELEEEAKHIVSSEKETHVVVDVEPVCDRKEGSFSGHDFKHVKQPSELENDDLKSTDSRLVGNEEAQSEVLSAPSEVLSAHDYENICAVNIAREAWGLRSWRGYSDIETWLHDDSVVRDRRRDTLTSTVTTITSASSEQSAASGDRAVTPPPLPSRRPRTIRSRQDDYLDTLTDDLAACERPLAEFNALPEVDTSLYMARPYIVDQHGTFFPLTTLDTIMEEIEETSTDTSDSVRYWHKHGSASTLVATIDEIRRGNSICNLYNSSELLWDSCGNPTLNVLNSQSELLHENSGDPHVSFESLYARGSYTHLSPEEVLFLSKLRPSDSEVVSCSSEQSPGRVMDVSTLDVNICPSYHNDILTENQFEDTLPLALKNTFGIKKLGNKAQQKRLMLQEKFESIQNDNLKCKTDNISSLTCSKDNIDFDTNTQAFAGSTEALVPVNDTNEIPGVLHRIHQWNNFLKSQNSSNNNRDMNKVNSLPRNTDNQNVSKSNVSSLKERRTLFLKQVLSPPRFQNWSRKGTSSIGSVQLRAS